MDMDGHDDVGNLVVARPGKVEHRATNDFGQLRIFEMSNGRAVIEEVAVHSLLELAFPRSSGIGY